MKLVRHSDPYTFLAAAGGFLKRDEAANNLMLSVPTSVKNHPEWGKPWFATVEDGGKVVATALRTPPYNLLLTKTPPNMFLPVLDDLEAAGMTPLPGVMAPVATAMAFAESWRIRTGGTHHEHMRMRIHSLTKVVMPEAASGELRQARESDVPLVADWCRAFAAEVPADDHIQDFQVHARRLQPKTFIWDDHGPVSLVSWRRTTDNVAAIGLVYTPPEKRNHGYASNAVAGTCRLLLEDGRKSICLFTDLANPVSNSIYAKIGFRPVCDMLEIRFDVPTETDISFRASDGVELSGTLNQTPGAKGACVILAPGLTATREEDGVFTALAGELAAAGLPSFRFDFRGHGKSSGKSVDVTVAGEARDLAAALDLMKGRGYTRFAIVAASFAGGAASQVVPVRKDVAALVLWNSVSAYNPVYAPETPEALAFFGSDAAVQESLRTSGYFAVGPDRFRLGQALYNEMRELCPGDAFAGLRIPVLLVHGDQDVLVPYHKSVELAKRISGAEMVTIRGGGHGFHSPAWMKEACAAAVGFLKKKLG